MPATTVYESDVQTSLDTMKKNVKTLDAYLGKKVQDVLKAEGRESILNQQQLTASALTQLKADVAAGDIAVAGAASLYGFIRGGCDANVYFGAGPGSLSFHGSMWTSPIGAGGGGAGAWAAGSIPTNGQPMDFTWWGAAVEGGAVNLLWSINGTVVGSLAVAVAGIAGGGGHGSGSWTKD